MGRYFSISFFYFIFFFIQYFKTYFQKKKKKGTACINNEPQKGLTTVPKFGLNVMKCEVAQVLRLTQKEIIPVRFNVPRKVILFTFLLLFLQIEKFFFFFFFFQFNKY